MLRPVSFRAAAVGVAVLSTACAPDTESPRPVAADVSVAWNERLFSVAEAEDGFLTLKGVRTAAMMHLAMHDVLTVVDPRYDAYVGGQALPGGSPDVDPVAAVNEAAYAVAQAAYPEAIDAFEEERERWRPTHLSAGEVEAARALGERRADLILAARSHDGWNADATYAWHPMGPGVYAEFNEHSGTPEGFVFGAGWAQAEPFVLDSASHFRSPPPPAIGSNDYTRAFDEVKDVGARTSMSRTEDQAHLAMWWKEFVEKSHNRLARELVPERGLDLWEATRLFALLNMSIFDGYVASFDAKFAYNHWRPYTAIRWAQHDGNPDTEPDPDWTNLHDHTYAFPSYPSAHGTVCAAAMVAFSYMLGDDIPFTMTIAEAESAGPMSPKVAMDPPSRSFAGFDDAAVECSLSRVYLGIHFRYDSEAGTELGRAIGEMATGRFLRPASGG